MDIRHHVNIGFGQVLESESGTWLAPDPDQDGQKNQEKIYFFPDFNSLIPWCMVLTAN